MSKDDKLKEFGEDLARIQQDDLVPVAEVAEVTVLGVNTKEIQIVFETISGRRFKEFFNKPDDWNYVSNLVLLLDYWGLDPQELSRLNDEEESFEVPLAGSEELDWEAIEREVGE